MSTVPRLESNGEYWVLAWQDSFGNRCRKSIGAKAKVTRRSAIAKRDAYARELADNPAMRDAGEPPTLKQWSTEFFQVHGVAESTQRRMMDTFGHMRAEWGDDCTLPKVTTAHAMRWAGKLRAGDAMGEATVRLHVRQGKIIFGVAKRMGFISANPFDGMDSSVPDPTAFTRISTEQVRAMLLAAGDDDWRRLIALCRWAGLRVGEALRLRWEDIDEQRRTLAVVPDVRYRSTKKSARTVPIQPVLWSLLERRGQGADRVCSVAVGSLNKQMSTIIQRAGIPAYPKPFHTLRKNCETDWLERFPVMSVVKWLGNSPAVAAKFYHTVPETTIQAVTQAKSEADVLRAEIERLQAVIATTLPQSKPENRDSE